MQRLIPAALATALFLGAEVQSQTQNRIFIDNGDAKTGGTNVFPWSREQLRYQLIFPAAKMGNVPCIVNDILAAPSTGMNPAIRTAVYDDIEIRMGMTAQSTPTSNWNTNNPNPTTIYRGPMRITFEKGVFRGIGMQKSFLYLPTSAAPNLCVEFIMWKLRSTTTNGINAVTAPSTVRRAYYYMWTVSQNTQASVGSAAARMGLICNNGNFVVTETGCQSSRNTTLAISADTFPQSNKPLTISLNGGLPTSVALLAIGPSDTKGFGGSLPFDAGVLGAPGCYLWNEALILVGTATDNSGTASLKFTTPQVSGAPRVFAHWWNYDRQANALGVTSSNYAKILLGN